MTNSSGGERTARFFDSYAGEFNDIYGNEKTLVNGVINGLFRKTMKVRYEKTLAACEPVAGKTVLDVGCGPGHYSVELARRGASCVQGIDFAAAMVDLAQARARRDNVSRRCRFEVRDFRSFPDTEKFDFVVAMGFMDYIGDARSVAGKMVALARRKALFSFPIDEGFLAWQRKLRYKARCDLFMYREDQIRAIFAGLPIKRLAIERISRDFFVTATIGSD